MAHRYRSGASVKLAVWCATHIRSSPCLITLLLVHATARCGRSRSHIRPYVNIFSAMGRRRHCHRQRHARCKRATGWPIDSSRRQRGHSGDPRGRSDPRGAAGRHSLMDSDEAAADSASLSDESPPESRVTPAASPLIAPRAQSPSRRLWIRHDDGKRAARRASHVDGHGNRACWGSGSILLCQRERSQVHQNHSALLLLQTKQERREVRKSASTQAAQAHQQVQQGRLFLALLEHVRL